MHRALVVLLLLAPFVRADDSLSKETKAAIDAIASGDDNAEEKLLAAKEHEAVVSRLATLGEDHMNRSTVLHALARVLGAWPDVKEKGLPEARDDDTLDERMAWVLAIDSLTGTRSDLVVPRRRRLWDDLVQTLRLGNEKLSQAAGEALRGVTGKPADTSAEVWARRYFDEYHQEVDADRLADDAKAAEKLLADAAPGKPTDALRRLLRHARQLLVAGAGPTADGILQRLRAKAMPELAKLDVEGAKKLLSVSAIIAGPRPPSRAIVHFKEAAAAYSEDDEVKDEQGVAIPGLRVAKIAEGTVKFVLDGKDFSVELRRSR